MKAIRLIGGINWDSTLEFYRLINELVAEKLVICTQPTFIFWLIIFEELPLGDKSGSFDLVTGVGVIIMKSACFIY